VGLSRDAFRHPPQASELNQELASRITEVAHLRRRFGYRRIHDVLRPAYPDINHKRIYRLYAEAGLAVRKRRKVKRPSNERQPLLPATTINEVWSMDFLWSAREPQLAMFLVAQNDSRLSIRPVVDRFYRSLAYMMKPHVPAPISVKASMRRKSRRDRRYGRWSLSPC
jgi:putative transposase